jgi:hypothetical protein
VTPGSNFHLSFVIKELPQLGFLWKNAATKWPLAQHLNIHMHMVVFRGGAAVPQKLGVG